ncbi:phosphate ABC transporter substrate-binding protein PstS family protein [Enterococcus mundtii]|uniref:phosphate ABC transporter substrate-binding protein PstS family protein n=1 Tax=Enterococcus TaxID=1350 RepID=UPI000452CA70|nr:MULTISPECIES: phosphate ABC transporter substrate-binding protein PstS family protein [Enterococcus]AZP93198.1 phosphate ABC transporter substrate-binding protein [Enterococcus mundtii]EYT96582.1 phosphate ABC transporter substrate-binding protein [Enterococcus mundtii CRL35]MDA9430136.1 Phosphate ABC transporter, periplasmic phosphate-binding protein PstS [Enterococcus mundtii 1A]MDK4210550.1 phosphate ABC transporter substrate-binding protein PstS family protein [Enterococcus mundtii]MDO7
MKKVLFSLGVLGFILAGCGSGSGSTDGSASNSASSDNQVKIVAVGSTALQPLVDAAQEMFTQDNPNYQISVQGGGSGTGLSQVASGAVTIGNSDVFAEQRDGIDASKLVDHRVAVVGMAPIVNKDTGVEDITKEQLIDIFTGKITNWSELGGADQEINVINRANGSGTRATFEYWALDGAVPIQSQEQDSSGTVRQIVSQTPGAISYLAFSYLDDSTQALKINGVEPTPENISDNSWEIWSYEHMYTNGEPEPEVKKFLDFMMTDAVQEGPVKDLGYLPISMMKVERDAEGNLS